MAESQSFEDALARLEDIVAQLEGGDLPLDESLALFEQGQKLAALCGQVLDQAELRLEELRDAGSQTYPPGFEE